VSNPASISQVAARYIAGTIFWVK